MYLCSLESLYRVDPLLTRLVTLIARVCSHMSSAFHPGLSYWSSLLPFTVVVESDVHNGAMASTHRVEWLWNGTCPRVAA